VFQLTWQDAAAWRQRTSAGGRLPAPPPDPAISHAGLICWEEHCVECAMPQCYASCSLYIPRADRKCARFAYGIIPNREVAGLFPWGADIRFRRWAKLQAALPSSLLMPQVETLQAESALLNGAERAVTTISNALRRLSPKRRLNGAFTAARRLLLEKQSLFTGQQPPTPHAFFLKCYSAESEAFRVQLELVTDRPVFRVSLQIQPGWNEHLFDADELLNPAAGKPGLLRLSIENDREVRLIFTWAHFVRFQNAHKALPAQRAATGAHGSPPAVAPHESPKPARRIKCVAWDLDNTLWNGVIGDAGADGVEPNSPMIGLIRHFDERGILQTIVSKNHHEVAWPKIEQLGLADYFLYPAIHWGPKSRSLQQIADELNINVDTFAMIDDSPFERHEVSQLLPQVRVYDPAVGPALIQDSAFDVPISAESWTRRLQYLTEARRRRVHQSWRGDYDEFLRSCHMVLKVRRPGEAEFSRCLELLQRSNQFNLNGHSYQEADFRQLLESPLHDCFCFEVSDDFGGYGIVGVAAFELSSDGAVLVDFVMSCRVAQKKVEATFLMWYAQRPYVARHGQLQARLKVTSRNMPLRDVLDELGFQCLRHEDQNQLLALSLQDAVSCSNVIQIEDCTESTATTDEPDKVSHPMSLSATVPPQRVAA